MHMSNSLSRSLVLLLFAVSITGLSFTKVLSLQALALSQQSTASITGRLDENSEKLEEGIYYFSQDDENTPYYETHLLEGTIGESLVIDLTSRDFDAYLLVIGPDGNLIAKDSDSGTGNNARISTELPTTGVYTVIVTTFMPQEIGSYNLSWRPLTEAELMLTGSTNGQLNESSSMLEDERFYDVHFLEGIAGERLTIDLTSGDFDAYLELVGPDGRVVAINDNDGVGLNARVMIELPITGTYQIIATSHTAAEEGDYSLTWEPATAADLALQTARRLDEQANEYKSQELYDEAETLYRNSLEIRYELLGRSHYEIANSLNYLARLYHDQERYEEAISTHEQVLELRRSANDSFLYTTLEYMAELYSEQGRYAEAEPLLHEALLLQKEKWGEDDVEIVPSLDKLAALYSSQGRYDDALSLSEEALEIQQETWGNSHPLVVSSLRSLASLYVTLGMYSKAQFLNEQALSIRYDHLNQDNRMDVAIILNSLASLYRLQGQYDEAEVKFRESLTIREEQLGEGGIDSEQSEENELNLAIGLDNLAELYRHQGRYEEAEPLFEQVLAIWRKHLGGNHINVATSISNLALLYAAQGRYEEARPLFEQSLSIKRAQTVENPLDVAIGLNNLASVYMREGRHEEAEQLIEEFLSISRRRLGEEHPDVAHGLNNLAGLYMREDRYEEAEQLVEESLSIFRKRLGEKHPDVALSLANLAFLGSF